jgi:hypothetical protein
MELNESLNREHLEEISALYDQWRGLMGSGTMNSLDFQDLEHRLDAHIDALADDGDGRFLCAEKALEGDAGDCYGAFRVLVRGERVHDLKSLISRIGVGDEKRLKGAADALCHEAPKSPLWSPDYLNELLNHDPCRARLAAGIAAYHRIDISRDLEKALGMYEKDRATVLDILKALDRLGSGAWSCLNFLEHPDSGVVDAAIRVLVRAGNPLALNACRKRVRPSDWPPLSLALCGDKEALAQGMDGAMGKITPAHMIAAGLTGDPAFLSVLMDGLDNPAVSESAAHGLWLITGIECREEHVIPGVTAYDELFDNEKESFRNGTLLADGKIPGRIVTRLAQNRAPWSEVLRKNRLLYDLETHYRLGKPLSPSRLVRLLKSTQIPDFIRQLIYDELTVRYGLNVPFDIRMPAPRQQNAAASCERWIQGSSASFMDGVLYYHKNPVTDEAGPNHMKEESP